MSSTGLGVADAKRRFSELIDRVQAGERIVISRRGKPAVTLVAPGGADEPGDRPAPTGFAALAGALAEWDELDGVVDEVLASRRGARDRSAPDLG